MKATGAALRTDAVACSERDRAVADSGPFVAPPSLVDFDVPSVIGRPQESPTVLYARPVLLRFRAVVPHGMLVSNREGESLERDRGETAERRVSDLSVVGIGDLARAEMSMSPVPHLSFEPALFGLASTESSEVWVPVTGHDVSDDDRTLGRACREDRVDRDAQVLVDLLNDVCHGVPLFDDNARTEL